MKNVIFLGITCGALLFFAACADPKPPYTLKALESQGRGITIAHSTPYNCKILGEVEGKDSIAGRQPTTFEKLRESAMNDLKNNAGTAVGNNKRIMLRINKEAKICQGFVKSAMIEDECSNFPQKSYTFPEAYRIHADIFECGEK